MSGIPTRRQVISGVIVVLILGGTIFAANQPGIPSGFLHVLIPIGVFSCIILICSMVVRHQRSKIFRPFLEPRLKERGYEFISERPLQLLEILDAGHIRPTFFHSSIPAGSLKYKSRNDRMISVKSDDGTKWLLQVKIVSTWADEIKMEIVKTRRDH